MEGNGSRIYTTASSGKAHDNTQLLLEEEDEELASKAKGKRKRAMCNVGL
jgi:hypothetical protein